MDVQKNEIDHLFQSHGVGPPKRVMMANPFHTVAKKEDPRSGKMGAPDQALGKYDEDRFTEFSSNTVRNIYLFFLFSTAVSLVNGALGLYAEHETEKVDEGMESLSSVVVAASGIYLVWTLMALGTRQGLDATYKNRLLLERFRDE